jgi:hypothetical protein
MVPTRFQPRETGPGPVRHHLVLFGPEVRLFRTRRLAANAHALVGAAWVNRLVLPLREPFRPLGGDQPLVTEFRIGGNNTFAAALGGSIDLRIGGRLSWRIVQTDLVVTHFGGVNFKHPRVSTGAVFTFGG